MNWRETYKELQKVIGVSKLYPEVQELCKQTFLLEVIAVELEKLNDKLGE